MGFFRKKDRGIIDLTGYRKEPERAAETREDMGSSESSGAFSFLGDMASASSSNSDTYAASSENAEARRRELSKRLLQLTEKIEDLSNQIYHLQQRLELVERKAGVGGY